MVAAQEKPEAELRRCLRDLVALSSLPIIWIGANAEQIANALTQLIVSILDVEFAWVTINDPAVNAFQAHNRATETGFVPRTPKSDWVKPNARFTTNAQPQRQMYGASVPIGLEPGSVLVALCCRSNFPTQTEHLLLRVAANQAAVAIMQWRTEQSLRSEIKQRETLEAREREQRSREMQRELAHANRVATLGQHTASIAHEVRQPLAAISSNGSAALRWLTKATPDLDEAREALQRIVDAAQNAGDIIDTIRLMFKKSDGERFALNANALIEEVLTVLRGDLERRRILVETRLRAALPEIVASRVQLQQVILNLVINAAEAMHSTTDRDRVLRVTSDRQEPTGILITVEDTGPGIEPENIERIFKPFYTTKSEGMGMGLAICRSIVEAHGGRLFATPGRSCGLAMQISLPASTTLGAGRVEAEAAE